MSLLGCTTFFLSYNRIMCLRECPFYLCCYIICCCLFLFLAKGLYLMLRIRRVYQVVLKEFMKCWGKYTELHSGRKRMFIKIVLKKVYKIRRYISA